MSGLFALFPIALLLLLMVGLGWSAARAGFAAALAALAIAVLGFGQATDRTALLGTLFEALFASATIVWIIFPALAIHEVQMRSGAAPRIGAWIGSLSNRPAVVALALAWFFALLLEGAAGFGTPVALVAPMLVALGWAPERALVAVLIGHAVGVSFGAVGIPMIPLLALFPGEPTLLSALIMLMHAALGWLLALVLVRVAEPEGATRPVRLALVAALLFLLPALLLAWRTGPELPTLGGALIGGALFVLLIRRMPRSASASSGAPAGLGEALLPYALIVVFILSTRLLPGVPALLQEVELRWELDGQFGGTVAPLYHPGTILMLALLLSILAGARRRQVAWPAIHAAAARLPRVAVALVAVLLLARIMVHGGLIEALAAAAAALFGAAWPVAAPLAGALGSFITGSATASNILFGSFQTAAAGAAGLSPTIALAGQGFGAGIGNLIAPHNIVAGAATVGLVGREGQVLKATLPICLVYAALGGALLLLLSRTLQS